MSWGSAYELRLRLGLPSADLHITLGFQQGDVFGLPKSVSSLCVCASTDSLSLLSSSQKEESFSTPTNSTKSSVVVSRSVLARTLSLRQLNSIDKEVDHIFKTLLLKLEIPQEKSLKSSNQINGSEVLTALSIYHTCLALLDESFQYLSFPPRENETENEIDTPTISSLVSSKNEEKTGLGESSGLKQATLSELSIYCGQLLMASGDYEGLLAIGQSLSAAYPLIACGPLLQVPICTCIYIYI